MGDILRENITIGKPECDLDYIFSEAFSKKFSRLTQNSRINDLIRKHAQAILVDNNGTYTETLEVFHSTKGKLLIKQKGKKNGFGPPNMVIFSQNFTCYVHFFMVFNHSVLQKLFDFLDISKKYRILHLVKKSKCKLRLYTLGKSRYRIF